MYIDIVITGFHGITKALNAAELVVMLSKKNFKVQQKSFDFKPKTKELKC
jgi:nucleoside-triphosphatase THEP1